MDRTCVCGDPRSAHEHYTFPGDLRCSLCQCPRWSWRGWPWNWAWIWVWGVR